MKPNKLQLSSVRKPSPSFLHLSPNLSFLAWHRPHSILKCNSLDRCQKRKRGEKKPRLKWQKCKISENSIDSSQLWRLGFGLALFCCKCFGFPYLAHYFANSPLQRSLPDCFSPTDDTFSRSVGIAKSLSARLQLRLSACVLKCLCFLLPQPQTQPQPQLSCLPPPPPLDTLIFSCHCSVCSLISLPASSGWRER